MQDRYIGDVGDFGKFAVLRRLCGFSGEQRVRTGVVWCRFPDETHTNDGRHISYLQSAQFLGLDDELMVALRDVVRSGKRCISAVISAGILPADTVYYDAPIAFAGSDRSQRIRYRSSWLDACVSVTKNCDLTFFDPDNGLEVASVPKGHPKSGKYIYWDELMPFWEGGSALLIYHHLNRTASAAQQIEALAITLKTRLTSAEIVPLVFRRGSSRVFWLIHHGDHLGRELAKRAADLLNGRWSRHFRPLGWPGNDQASTRARSRSTT